jgi:hypothetical protein
VKRALLLAFPLCAGGCGGEDPAGGATRAPWFVEDARASGLDFTHVSALEPRFEFPEIMGGGVALLDSDGDGDLDVYCVQSGDLHAPPEQRPANRLFRNTGGGRFEDVTDAAGVGDRGYGMGAACGDYDRDGDVDLYVTNFGSNVLYQNEGDGTFRDVTAASGTADPGWSTSAAFVDVDGDGWLDLFVVHYIDWSPAREGFCRATNDQRDYCPPTYYRAPVRDTLLRNRGDGTFEDVSERAGLGAAFGNGLGVAWGDFDGRPGPELFVANDMTPNQYWRRADDGTLRDESLLAGCAFTGTGFAGSGMGVHAVDVENDGDLDVFVTQLRRQGHALYVNKGGWFDDETARFGIFTPSLPHTGFGTGLHDFDHDGDLDLYVADGRVTLEEPIPDPRDPYAEPDFLMERTGPASFALVRPAGGCEPPLVASSRAAAFGDLDDDGDVDVVVVNRDGPLHLLRNRRGAQGGWIELRVLDERGSDALGARVELTAGGVRQIRHVQVAYSYCASNDPRVHFGLGLARGVDAVRVVWPDGTAEDFGALAPGRVHVLRRE